MTTIKFVELYRGRGYAVVDTCKIAAAKAYDEKAKELFKEFARTNF